MLVSLYYSYFISYVPESILFNSTVMKLIAEGEFYNIFMVNVACGDMMVTHLARQDRY